MLGKVFGFGIKENLGETLIFLMRVYQPGDRVFMFGFSRCGKRSRILGDGVRCTPTSGVWKHVGGPLPRDQGQLGSAW
jgi:hypothetical protein